MARPRFKSSIRSRGWTGESHRHYLASKGIKTAVKPHQYFVNDLAKGNRDSSATGQGGLKAAYANGFTKQDLIDNPDVRETFQVPMEALTRKTRKFPKDFSRAEEAQIDDVQVQENITPEALPQEDSQEQSFQEDFQPQTAEEELNNMVKSSATSSVPGPNAAFFFKKEKRE